MTESWRHGLSYKSSTFILLILLTVLPLRRLNGDPGEGSLQPATCNLEQTWLAGTWKRRKGGNRKNKDTQGPQSTSLHCSCRTDTSSPNLFCPFTMQGTLTQSIIIRCMGFYPMIPSLVSLKITDHRSQRIRSISQRVRQRQLKSKRRKKKQARISSDSSHPPPTKPSRFCSQLSSAGKSRVIATSMPPTCPKRLAAYLMRWSFPFRRFLFCPAVGFISRD